jgi:hypothetical protein
MGQVNTKTRLRVKQAPDVKLGILSLTLTLVTAMQRLCWEELGIANPLPVLQQTQVPPERPSPRSCLASTPIASFSSAPHAMFLGWRICGEPKCKEIDNAWLGGGCWSFTMVRY